MLVKPSSSENFPVMKHKKFSLPNAGLRKVSLNSHTLNSSRPEKAHWSNEMYDGNQSAHKSAHKSRSSLHNSGLHIANISVSGISNNSMSRPYDQQTYIAKISPMKSHLNMPAQNSIQDDYLEAENNRTAPEIRSREAQDLKN